MRLRSNADRHEIRQQYLPALWNKTVGVLQKEGKDSVQDVIDFMDSYYLTKEDFDALQELGLGPIGEDKIKIETATKAAFTRKYNAASHPMPFVKASTVGAAGKLGEASAKAKPDLEEAVEESEDEAALLEAAEQGDEEDEELDLKKDKYIKAPKKKAAAKGTATSKGKAAGKGKRKKAGSDEADNEDVVDESESEAPPPAKKGGASGRGRGGARGRGRGK